MYFAPCSLNKAHAYLNEIMLLSLLDIMYNFKTSYYHDETRHEENSKFRGFKGTTKDCCFNLIWKRCDLNRVLMIPVKDLE